MSHVSKISSPADIARLVATVERLAFDDQARILRIVDLLLLAPPDVRWHTQRMLRSLIARGSGSKAECVSAVDEVILYLEKSLVRVEEAEAAIATHH